LCLLTMIETAGGKRSVAPPFVSSGHARHLLWQGLWCCVPLDQGLVCSGVRPGLDPRRLASPTDTNMSETTSRQNAF